MSQTQKSLTKNAVYNLIKAFNNIVFPIISFPYASRILLPEGIGKINFANSIIDYFLLIAELGIASYSIREASKIRDDQQKLNKFSREILFLNFCTTFISYTLLAISLFLVPKFSAYRLLLIICATKVLFTTIGFDWLYIAKEEFGYITLRSGLFQIISLVLLFGFVRTPDDYLIYAGIGVFANVGSNIFNFIYSKRYINLFEKTKMELKKHLKPIMTFFGIRCATKINNTLDAVMLGFMLTDVSVGLYSAAIKISRLVIELITSVVSSFMPRSSYFVENNKLDEYKLFVEKVCGLTFFFSIPFAIGLFVLCEPFIIIFSGNEFLPAVPSMKVLSLGIVAWCTNSFFNNLIITPNRKEKFTLVSQIAGVIVNIALNLVLIKKYEVLGAAIATIAVEFTWPLVLLPVCWKHLKSWNNLWGILKSLAGSLIMFAVIYFAFGKIEKAVVKVAASFFTGCAVYAVVEILLRHQSAILICGTIQARLFKKK